MKTPLLTLIASSLLLSSVAYGETLTVNVINNCPVENYVTNIKIGSQIGGAQPSGLEIPNESSCPGNISYNRGCSYKANVTPTSSAENLYVVIRADEFVNTKDVNAVIKDFTYPLRQISFAKPFYFKVTCPMQGNKRGINIVGE